MSVHRFLLASLLLAPLAVSCRSTAGLPDSDREQINTAAKAWTNAVVARDHAKVASFYTADAVLMPINMDTIRGRAAIREFFDALPPVPQMTTTLVEVEGCGDLAYVWGTYKMKLAIAGLPAPIDDRGKYIEIWRRQADGSWLMSRDIYNSDLPMPGTP